MNQMETSKTGNNIIRLEALQNRWIHQLKDNEMIYVYAMTGFGKTTQAIAFAKERFRNWERLSAGEEDFIEKLCAFEAESLKVRVNTLLILDDLQWLIKDEMREEFFDTLLRLRRNKKIRFMLISRANVPSYLASFRVTRQISVNNRDDLSFSYEDVKALLHTYPVLSQLEEAQKDKLAQHCMNITGGYALGVSAFFQRVNGNPKDAKTAVNLAIQDVHDYLSTNLFGQWTSTRKNAAICLSVYDHFTLEMAERIIGEQAAIVLKDFMEVGSFLKYKEPDTYYFETFFREYLVRELRKRPEEEWMGLFEIAGLCYEKERNYKEALDCWKTAKRQDKIAEIVVYLSENAEGCAFARIAAEYMKDLSIEWEERDPRILGAKAMLAAYQMKPEECLSYLERLKKLAGEEKGQMIGSSAISAYVRTSIACPYNTADKLKEHMLLFVTYIKDNGIYFNNIMPTGNMPSLINGGLDLLPWMKNKKLLYPVIKVAAEKLMGKEAIGIADASIGEAYYEQNEITQAMASLTKALSASNFNGSIRVQYAATAIMARLFQSEGQMDTSDEILGNILEKVKAEKFNELIPNIQSTLVNSALMKHDMFAVEEWLAHDAPNEHDTFYITFRYQLLTKAKVYVATGKYLEALYILNLLEPYAKLYHRTYFQIEVLILKSIILYRREESWEEELMQAAAKAKPFGLIRVFADQGAALLPLWKSLDWEAYKFSWNKINVIEKAMKKMAIMYPNYLKEAKQYGDLTKKERQVLSLIADGYNNSKIAKAMEINLGTVKFHVTNILKKLDAENRTVAVKIAKEEGML